MQKPIDPEGEREPIEASLTPRERFEQAKELEASGDEIGAAGKYVDANHLALALYLQL